MSEIEINWAEVYRKWADDAEKQVIGLQRLLACVLEMHGGSVVVPDWVLQASELTVYRDESKPGLVISAHKRE